MQAPTRTLERAQAAWKQKLQWDDVIREAFRYGMPQRNLHDYTLDTSVGAKKGGTTYDSTAVASVQKFSHRVVDTVFPPHRKWARLQAGPMVPKDQKKRVNEVLEAVTDRFFAILHNASNFQSAVGEWAYDLAAGTATMALNKGDLDHPLIWAPVPVVAVAPEEGAHGEVGGVYRKIKIKIRLIKEQWPDARLPKDLRDKTGSESDKPVTLWDCTYRDAKTGQWVYEVLWECGTDDAKRLVRRTSKHPALNVTRFMKSSNEVQGRGPLLNALPDIKTLNKLIELVLKNASYAVTGVWTVADDGVTNPDTVRIVPGAMIKVARNQGHPSGPSIAPMQMSHDFNVSMLEQERLSTSIKSLMFDNALPPMAGPVRSATEYIERMKDLAQDIGPAFGRLVSEAMVPWMQAGIDILMDMGLMADIEGLEGIDTIRVGGVNVQLVVTSPLATLQNLEEVEAIIRTMEMTQTLLGPEAAAGAFKVEELPERLATKLGFPADLIRDAKEQKQLQDLVASKLAEMQMAVAAEQQPQQAAGVMQ